MAPQYYDKHITSISNASESLKMYPDNKVARWRALLPKPIELPTHTGQKFVIGLKELQVQISFYNVYRDECYVTVLLGFGSGKGPLSDPTVLVIMQGFYKDVRCILNQINAINMVANNVTFKYNEYSGRVEVVQKPNGLRVNLSPKLRAMLGFKTEGETFVREGPAPNTVNLNVNLPRQLFVHCDVVEPQLVGDTKSRVLRTVGLDDVDRFGRLFVKTYEAPDYVPVLKPHFGTIEFDIRTHDGKRAPFEFGPSLVKVHIRSA
jgi:hypothetical protein